MLKILATMLMTTVPAFAQDASTAAYSEAPEEVVVRSAASDELRTRKPPLKVNVDKFESIAKSLEADKTLLRFDPGDLAGLSRNHPDRLHGDRVIRPWNAALYERNTIVFHPRRKFEELFGPGRNGKAAKELQWSLSITDEEGLIFHKYSGTGLPPETLNWSGENERREWVAVGRSYAPVYVFTDEYGSPRTAIDETIKFPAVVYRRDGSLTISLDSAGLFGPNKNTRTLDKKSGEALLSAAADLISRRCYNMPLTVKVYAQSKDLADQQAGLVKERLNTSLMLAERLLSSEGSSETYARQRADIIILTK